MIQNIYVPPSQWRAFFEKLLLGLAGLSFLASVLFFIAYNWETLDRWFKFILIELLMVLSIGGSLLTKDSWLAQTLLFFASFLVGIFIGLFGQVYQTQADSWELFFYWSVLITPWVFVSRFIGSWLLWFTLIELCVILYFDTTYILWILFVLNSGSIVLWIWITQKITIENDTLLYRLFFLASTITITLLIFMPNLILSLSTWIAWGITIYYFYRYLSINIYALSMLCISLVIVVDVIFIRLYNSLHIKSLLLLFFLVGALTISLSSYLSHWLKALSKEDTHATK